MITRLYGSDERYRQTFSSISNLPDFGEPACSYRCGETPTRFSFVPDNELGAAAHWNQPLGAGLLIVAGADAHDVRIWDQEQNYGSTAALTNLRDHQRDSAGYAEAMWVRKGWTMTGSGTHGLVSELRRPAGGVERDELGAYGHAAAAVGASASSIRAWGCRGNSSIIGRFRRRGFRAFRAPTPNELYRSTQVGNELTYPNGSLLSERATGWETGAGDRVALGHRADKLLSHPGEPAHYGGDDDAPPRSPILLRRENLGQIESRGVSVDFRTDAAALADGGWRLPVRARHSNQGQPGSGQLDSRGGAQHGYAERARVPAAWER